MKVPVYIRLTGSMNAPIVYNEDYHFEVGKMITLQKGKDVAILATGSMVYECLQTANLLRDKGIEASVINVHTIKPLDYEVLVDICSTSGLLISVEEHNIIGGLGSAIADFLSQLEYAPRLLKIGIQDEFPHAASYEYLLHQYNLTAPQIAQRISEELS